MSGWETGGRLEGGGNGRAWGQRRDDDHGWREMWGLYPQGMLESVRISRENEGGKGAILKCMPRSGSPLRNYGGDIVRMAKHVRIEATTARAKLQIRPCKIHSRRPFPPRRLQCECS